VRVAATELTVSYCWGGLGSSSSLLVMEETMCTGGRMEAQGLCARVWHNYMLDYKGVADICLSVVACLSSALRLRCK
jgi:hypothetical protein